MGLSGIGAVALRALSLTIWPMEEGNETQKDGDAFKSVQFMYFSTASILVLSIIAHVHLMGNPFAVHHLQKLETASNPQPDQVDALSAGSEDAQALEEKDGASKLSYFETVRQSNRMTNGLLLSLFYVFALTLTCYPGLALNYSLKLMSEWSNKESWRVVITQAIFNSCDLIGRWSGGRPGLALSSATIKFWVYLRTLFIATFLFVSFHVAPKFFLSDWFIMTNLVLFSLSSGYLNALCCVISVKSVADNFKSQVGGFLVLTIISGILVGSLLAIGMKFVIEASPEF